MSIEEAYAEFRSIKEIASRASEIIGLSRWRSLSQTEFQESDPENLKPSHLVHLLEQCLRDFHQRVWKLLEEKNSLDGAVSSLTSELKLKESNHRLQIEQLESKFGQDRTIFHRKIDSLKKDAEDNLAASEGLYDAQV